VDNHGPLKGPVFDFSITRDAKLQLQMVTRAPESAQDNGAVHPPATVRINEDKVTFASNLGLELTAEGVQPTNTLIHIEGAAPGVLEQKIDIHRLKGILYPYDREVKFTIDWLENVDSVFQWPDMIEDKFEGTTTRTFGRNGSAHLTVDTSDELTVTGSNSPEGNSWACVRLSVDGTTFFLCHARAGIVKHIQKPGYIVYVGNPSDEFRDKVRRCLSFSLGLYLVYLGSSWFCKEWHLIRFEANSAYSLAGRAMELPPTPPSPLGNRSLWEIDRNLLSRMVNSLYTKYDELNFGVVSWAYWHAVTATSHIAAVHYGAALESLQRAYSVSHTVKLSQQNLEEEKWQALHAKLEKCLNEVELTPEMRQIFKNKLQNLNNRSQHSLAKDLIDSLGLILGPREKTAHDARHESAHGKDDEVDVEWIRDLKIMRIRFHRILLSITNASESYYDYFSLHHPVRKVAEPILE
jgi:hypothetical protein